MIPILNYFVKYDETTRQVVLCRGSAIGDFTVLGPVSQNAVICDLNGNEADVTQSGSIYVAQKEIPEIFGLPQYATDAAAEADDTYYDLMVATKACMSCSVYVETCDAIISFDGGTTDHFFVDVDAGQILLTGLNIPVGSVISGKNAVATEDYTNLRVTIW